MAYTNSVTLLDTEGGPLTTKVTVRLWKLGSADFGTHNLDVQEDTAPDLDLSLDGTTPTSFTFAGTTTFAPHHGVGLSIQDSNRVAPLTPFGKPGPNDTGWLFRSGWFEQSLLTGAIEVIAAVLEITPAMVPSILPGPLPLTVDAATTITALTGTLADGNTAAGTHGGIDIVATGSSTTGGGATFDFTVRLLLTPETDISAPEVQALVLALENEHIQLTSGANLANFDTIGLLDTLTTYLTDTAGPQLVKNIESLLAQRIISAEGRTLSGPLPTGVLLSVRSVNPSSQHILIRGALGAFGGVNSKLPAPPSGSGGGGGICSFQTLATLGHSVVGLEILRVVRDGRLAATSTGRWATEAYYRFGDEASALLTRHPSYAARAAALANELAATLGTGSPVSSSLRARGEAFLRDLAALGSAELRAAVAHGIEGGVTDLL